MSTRTHCSVTKSSGRNYAELHQKTIQVATLFCKLHESVLDDKVQRPLRFTTVKATPTTICDHKCLLRSSHYIIAGSMGPSRPAMTLIHIALDTGAGMNFIRNAAFLIDWKQTWYLNANYPDWVRPMGSLKSFYFRCFLFPYVEPRSQTN